MYLAPSINRRLDMMRKTLTGSVPLEVVQDQVQTAVKRWGAQAHIVFDPNVKRLDFCCSGSYDYTKRRMPIEVSMHFHQGNRNYNFTPLTWNRFKFLLSQLIQHELIHKHQYSHRVGLDASVCLYYDIKGGEKSDKDHMDYLAELDEIDAYAHDIALEIAHHYPRHDPYKVLDTINKRKKIWSWHYYKDAFKHSEDWNDVKHRLLKKTYQWIPHIKE
jgi:hypothetical protein